MQRSSDRERAYRDLQRRADRISSLIVTGDYPAIDVVIQIRNLRGFRRLWEQFREPREEPLPDW